MSTERQHFARQRNWWKGRMIGILANLSGSMHLLTPEEIKEVKEARKHLGRVLENWDENYKEAAKLNINKEKLNG